MSCCRRYLIALVLLGDLYAVYCDAEKFAIAPRRSSPYPYAWRWWIAHSILWIVKGGFWLTIFILVILYKSLPKKHDCCSPIILHDPIPYDQHHSSIGWARKDDSNLASRDWQLYWRDKMLQLKQDFHKSL